MIDAQNCILIFDCQLYVWFDAEFAVIQNRYTLQSTLLAVTGPKKSEIHIENKLCNKNLTIILFNRVS